MAASNSTVWSFLTPSTLELFVWSFDVKPVAGCSLWDSALHAEDEATGQWEPDGPKRGCQTCQSLCPRFAAKKKRQISKSISASSKAPLCQLQASKTRGLVRLFIWILNRMTRDNQQQWHLRARCTEVVHLGAPRAEELELLRQSLPYPAKARLGSGTRCRPHLI